MDEKNVEIIEEGVEVVNEVTKKGIGTRTKFGIGIVAAGLIAGAAYKLYKRFGSNNEAYEELDDDWDEFFDEDDDFDEEAEENTEE